MEKFLTTATAIWFIISMIVCALSLYAVLVVGILGDGVIPFEIFCTFIVSALCSGYFGLLCKYAHFNYK
ncbi:TMhelix containing protein [Vibrio phage 1.187.O._10N.286.49.F1]|nr:TMhelix containing protein [Vibrio phage 1.187.O._10N.286.49.F1]